MSAMGLTTYMRPSPDDPSLSAVTVTAILCICALCFTFVAWRRAHIVRQRISIALNTLRREGRIRLEDEETPLDPSLSDSTGSQNLPPQGQTSSPSGGRWARAILGRPKSRVAAPALGHESPPRA